MLRTRVISFGLLCLTLSVGVCFPSRAAADELVDLVVGLLGDEDKDVRALGFEQVRSEAKGEAATKLFAAQLPKLKPEAQVGLLSALSDRGDRAARPDVVALLDKSSDETVRVAAVKALGFLGDPTDTKRLVKLLDSKSKGEQSAAQRSLIDLAGEAVPGAIVAEMKEATPELRVTLIGILASRRAFGSSEALLAAAIDEDATVRKAAMKALGELAGPEHIAGMVQGVLKAADSRERADAEKRVMFACARIKDADKRAVPVLAAMQKLSEGDRRKMLSTLGRVGGATALKVVEEAIASDDSKLHELGIKALCNWPDASVAPRLMELSINEDHASHKIATLRALIRVAPLKDDRSDADRLQILRKAMVMATRDDERKLALDRARGIRTVESLRFVLPYTDQVKFAEQACLSIVELAHHRGLRVPNQAEFDKALDKVIATSKDAVVVDRAQRYKKDETWVRPKK